MTANVGRGRPTGGQAVAGDLPLAAVEGAGAPALLVVGHGSRDPEAGAEFDRLVAAVTSMLPGTAVGAGYLELAEPFIDDALDTLVAGGADDIVAVPVVLFGAGHLKDDGPAVLGRARRRHPGVRFRLARDMGVHPAVLAAAEDRARAALRLAEVTAGSAASGRQTAADVAGAPADDETAVVLVGRGSTDPDACAEMVKLARLLEDGRGLGSIEAAFAAMSRPDVEGALERCRRLGARRVAVVPLFLFAGVLVERVAERAERWAADHPEMEVVVGEHLGPDARLAALVVERHREAFAGDVRMNCDVCVYRVRLPGFEDKLGTPLSLSPADRPARGWRARRAASQDAERVDRLQVAAQARGGSTLGAMVLPGAAVPPATAFT